MLKSRFFVVNCLLSAVLFAGSVKAIEFNCTFITLTLFSETRYTCVAEVIQKGSSSLENVTGDHQTGRINDDVRFLGIEHQSMMIIPEGIPEFFSNLDALYIVASFLMSISANDLRPFSHLVYLNLCQNQLTSLDGDLFIYTHHSCSIWISQINKSSTWDMTSLPT